VPDGRLDGGKANSIFSFRSRFPIGTDRRGGFRDSENGVKEISIAPGSPSSACIAAKPSRETGTANGVNALRLLFNSRRAV
jgi:hypothetical protein